MASDVRGTRVRYQGILVPDPRVTESAIWAAESSYTQAGPRADVPVPSQATAMSLAARGTRSTTTDHIVRVARGGHARDGAEYYWRPDGESDRGWDWPITLSAWEYIAATTSSDGYRQPHAVTLDDDTVACVYGEYSVPLMYIRVRVRSTAGTWGSAVTVASEPGTDYPAPCLVAVPRDEGTRLLCLYWSQSSGGVRQLQVQVSDDGGATWAMHAPRALFEADPTETIQRMRCAYRSGQLCMLVWSTEASGTQREVIRQYASTSLGAAWDLIAQLSGDTAGMSPDIVATAAGFIAAYCRGDATNAGNYVSALLGSAYDAISDTYRAADIRTGGGQTSGATAYTAVDVDVALAYDAAIGRVWAYVRNGAGDDGILARYTDNYGTTWIQPIYGSTSDGALARLVAEYSPIDYAATWQRDRVILVANAQGVGGRDRSLSAYYVGGYSTIPMPSDHLTTAPTQWGTSILPVYELAAAGAVTLTLSGLGPPSEDAAATGYTLSAVVGEEAYVTDTCSGDVSQGQIAQVQLVSLTTGSAFVRLRSDDGSEGYEVGIQITSGGSMTITDQSGGGTLLDTIAVTLPIQILIGIKGTSCGIWYRTPSTSEDRTWTYADHYAITDDGGAVGTDRLRYGVIGVGTGGDPTWGLVQWGDARAVGVNAGQNQWADAGNTDVTVWRARGRPLATGTYAGDGIYITARGGPVAYGDSWTIATDYEYPVRHLLDGSPRLTWRSTSTAAQQIAWDLTGLAADGYHGSEILGVAVIGTDSPRVLVEGYEQGTGWTTLGTLDLAARSSGLRYSRAGDTIYPDTGSASSTTPVIWHGEYVDGTFAYDDTTARRVRWHSSGHWTTATTRRPELILSDVDSGDPASGTAGDLWGRSGVLLVHLGGATYRGIRLTWQAPSAGTVPPLVDGYHTAGRVVIGPVIVHGDAPDWSETITQESGVVVSETQDRRTYARRMAPDRRRVTYTIPGVDEYRDTVLGDPDYLTAGAGGRPVTLAGTTARDLQGLIRTLGTSPCVYLSDIQYLASGSTQVLTRRDTHLLARPSGDVTITQELGEPGYGAVWSASVSLVEEV